MPFKPGQSGNPNGRPAGSKNKTTKKVDEAFEAAFETLQEQESTTLVAWAKDNLTEFYKLYARKLTTSAENHNTNTTELPPEQARRMAEEYLAATSSAMGAGQPAGVHDRAETGLPAGDDPPADRGSPTAH